MVEWHLCPQRRCYASESLYIFVEFIYSLAVFVYLFYVLYVYSFVLVLFKLSA